MRSVLAGRTIVGMGAHESSPPPGGLSRRRLLAGLGAATGAAGLLGQLPGGAVVAGSVRPSTGPSPSAWPLAFDLPSPDLTYVGVDAAAFHVHAGMVADRYSDDDSGTGHANPPGVIAAPVHLPSGAVVRSISVAYVGNGHRMQLWRRRMTAASTLDTPGPTAVFDEVLPDQGAGSSAETFTTEHEVAADSSYTLRSPVAAGQSVLGVTIGYEPPPIDTAGSGGGLAIVPIDPPTRPLDTRQPGPQQGKLQADEERVVELGLPPGAEGAVINLTITGTETDFGYVSVYRAGIPWPGNSSINWSSPELTAANGVITAVDDQGRIAIRGGEAATHVVIDLVGALV